MPQVKVVWRKRRSTFVIRFVENGIWREVSASTRVKRDAERAAGRIAADLDAGRSPQTARNGQSKSTLANPSWETFCERYRTEKLSQLREKTADQFEIANNSFTQFLEFTYGLDADQLMLVDVSESTMSEFQSFLRSDDSERSLEETSIASYLRTIRAALGWATKMRLIDRQPFVDMPKHGNKSRHMRGRPLTDLEIKRIIMAAKKRRQHDADQWERYFTGLHLSGLRLTESQVFSWHRSDPISIDLTSKYPQMRILGESEKGGKDRLLPLTPDFAEWALKTPLNERKGLVFGIMTNGRPMSVGRLGRLVGEIGKKANVIVDPAAERFATCHDFRRTFGNRWATRVTPAVLQKLMRHVTIETTMKYYVELDSMELGRQLYAEHRSSAE